MRKLKSCFLNNHPQSTAKALELDYIETSAMQSGDLRVEAAFRNLAAKILENYNALVFEAPRPSNGHKKLNVVDQPDTAKREGGSCF